jgi:hypothetical protein
MFKFIAIHSAKNLNPLTAKLYTEQLATYTRATRATLG